MRAVEAFKANLDTFYDLSTGRRANLSLRYIAVIGLGAALQYSGSSISKDALEVVASVLGVLLGFGYSVQFYIAGTTTPHIDREDYLEDAADKKILSRLASEVYANVVYLNFVILFGPILSFALLVPTPVPLRDYAAGLIFAGGFLNWVFLIEVVSTFYRVLVRSSFFFSERRRLAGSGD